MKSFCGILIFAAFACISGGHELSKDFQKCKVEDNACLLRRTNEIIKSHPEGFNELHLENIEPLKIDSIRFSGNPNTPVNFDLSMTDLNVYGLSKLTMSKFSGFTNDPKDIKDIQSEGVVPLMVIEGKYKISGKLLVVPIVGEGDIKISITRLQIKTQIKPNVQVRNGKSYLKGDKPKIKVKADGLKVELTNLFNGEKSLADSTIQVINDNWQILWEEISPQVAKEILLANTRILDEFWDHFPYEDLFL